MQGEFSTSTTFQLSCMRNTIQSKVINRPNTLLGVGWNTLLILLVWIISRALRNLAIRFLFSVSLQKIVIKMTQNYLSQ